MGWDDVWCRVELYIDVLYYSPTITLHTTLPLVRPPLAMVVPVTSIFNFPSSTARETVRAW